MKVVILAGGFGTRIAEESQLKPKPMVEIGEMPLIWHIMKIYSAYGFNDFVICLGYKGDVIKAYFLNYFYNKSDITVNYTNGNEMIIHNTVVEPWKITLADTGLETMTGGRLKRIQKYLDDEPFMLTYGDGVSDIDLTKLVEFHQKHGKFATVTAVQPAGRFGTLEIVGNDARVWEFKEKPMGDGAWINGGFFILQPEIFSHIQADHSILEKEVLEGLAKEGQLMAYKHTGFWYAMDTLKDKHYLIDLWKTGEAPWKKDGPEQKISKHLPVNRREEHFIQLNRIRKSILQMAFYSKSSHVGSSLSLVEILYVLYFRILDINPNEPNKKDRDKLILSKGHGSSALYATLAERGFFPKEYLGKYYSDGGILPGHLDKESIPGIEASAGSLGHGLSLGVGMAIANRQTSSSGRVFVVLGDGECNEGSIWEAIMIASHLKLSNVTVIVDFNKLQGLGRTNEVMNQDNLAERWESFGWETYEADGHNVEILEKLLKKGQKGPKVIIAHTVKGRGVPFMEDRVEWHYKSPSKEEYERALKELGDWQ